MTYENLNDHPFSPASVARESGALTESRDRAWMRWINQAEKLIGHSLDGTQWVNGYCFDLAFDAFTHRKTPAAYVASVRADPLYEGEPK